MNRGMPIKVCKYLLILGQMSFEIPLPILILQHPQEPSRKDHAISSAEILKKNLKYCHVAVGLSWRNLSAALKGFQSFDAFDELPQQEWGTLYLGTQKDSQDQSNEPGVYASTKNRANSPPLSGLIVLDGTWAQAKTLWWRNPWLLKTQRFFLHPKEPSRYGNLRKEPRPECVSTLEVVAETLTFLGIDPAVEKALKEEFSKCLAQYRKNPI